MLLTGLVHFISGMMYVNFYYPEISLTVNKVTDLPLLASALCYLGSTIKLSLDPLPNKKLDRTLFVIGGVIFILAFAANVLLKDTY